MSVEQLMDLAQGNPINRGLLAAIRIQFVRRGATVQAQEITNRLMALSGQRQAQAAKAGAEPLDSKMSLPELQRYFRQQAFRDPDKLLQLLKLLQGRNGQASENFSIEVEARLRQIQPPQANRAAPSPTRQNSPPVRPSEAMNQADYEKLYRACQAGNATPDQVRLVLAEMDRRKFPVNHPIRKALEQGLQAAPTRASSTPIVAKNAPVDPGPLRPTPERRSIQELPKAPPEVAITSNAARLEQRKKLREARRRERPTSLSLGFIEIKPRPEKPMVEVYLGSPERLIATVANMKRSATKMREYQGITEAELAAAMVRLQAKAWKDEGERRRDRRLLPYLMLAGNPANVSRFGIEIFLDELRTDDRLSTVKEMIQRYFHADFEHYPEQRKALGAWIRQRLQQVDLAKCKRPWVHHFHHHQDLFGSQPLAFAATFLPPARGGWENWEELNLPTQSWLYNGALAAAVRAAIQWPNSGPIEELFRRLQRTEASDVTGYNTRVVHNIVESLEVRRRCIEAALLEHLRLGTTTPDTALIAFALDTLKDPRQKDSAHWYGVQPEAKALMQAWLSIEDLELFFGELAEDSDEKSRVQYWKPFVMNRMVSTSRIFLGEGVIRRKRNKVEKYLQQGRYARLTGQGSDEVCAFVLRIKEAIIVEFSKVNNACYIYNAQSFNSELFGVKTVAIRDLKNTTAADWLSHGSNWTKNFDRFLFREFRIQRPSQ